MTSAIHTPAAENAAWYTIEQRGTTFRLVVGGFWIISEAPRLDPDLRALDIADATHVEIDVGALGRLDTVGAWLLLRTKRILEQRGIIVEPVNVRPEYRALVHTIDYECRAPPVELPPRHSFISRLDRIGRGLVHALHQGYELLGFLGLVVFETVATVAQPRRLRFAALVHQMEETGLNALPIVGLLSFLVGVVFAYQGSDQLRQFGAELFTVNLLAVGFLRELGWADGGDHRRRTIRICVHSTNRHDEGQRGTRCDPDIRPKHCRSSLLPRLLGIILTLPLLTFYSNVMGLIGGQPCAISTWASPSPPFCISCVKQLLGGRSGSG